MTYRRARGDREAIWIDYNTVLRARQREFGGSSPVTACRPFVEHGIEQRHPSPFDSVLQGWILGGQAFADRSRNLMFDHEAQPEVPRARELRSVDVAIVWAATVEHYGMSEESLRQLDQAH